MKKDLSIIANELFSDLVQDTYEHLLHSYLTDGKTNISPRLSIEEAIHKYTPHILNVIENKSNWKKRSETIFVDFHDFLTVFDEFFPVYISNNGFPYLDIGVWNHTNGKKIVRLLLTEIFYQNYTGMNIQDIAFIREELFSQESIRIFLKSSK
jgi:hypothetical protein